MSGDVLYDAYLGGNYIKNNLEPDVPNESIYVAASKEFNAAYKLQVKDLAQKISNDEIQRLRSTLGSQVPDRSRPPISRLSPTSILDKSLELLANVVDFLVTYPAIFIAAVITIVISAVLR